jgi:hypothetical protein
MLGHGGLLGMHVHVKCDLAGVTATSHLRVEPCLPHLPVLHALTPVAPQAPAAGKTQQGSQLIS